MTLKQSRRGTRFFAHKVVGPCDTAVEREEHLRLKAIAVAAARASGWTAETEIVGETPSGAAWRADVLAQRGAQKVAIEIQWSNQTNEETMRRQARYKESGVRCLWLFRRPGFPVTHELPAVCVGGNPEGGFAVSIPRADHPAMTAYEFLSAAFSGRFKFGILVGANAVVSVRGGFARCWHDRCQAETRILTGIDVAFGSDTRSFTVSELGKHRRLLTSVLDQLPSGLGVGEIKPRFSKTQDITYVSNGCVRCDRLFGEHFEHEASDDQQTLCSFPIQITTDWRDAIEAHSSYEAIWGVYPVRVEPAAMSPLPSRSIGDV